MPRPLIGITCDYDQKKQTSQLYSGYYYAILKSGGLPFLIPNIGEDHVSAILALLDGVLFTGGQDIDPVYFGETPHPKTGYINPYRDELEISLCKAAMEKDIPVLGICRGIQLMNIAMGGTIYQDLDSQWDRGSLQKHSQLAPDWYGTHGVDLSRGSKLATIFGGERLRVNSYHHQALKDVAPCFEITAICQDDVVEGIESQSHSFAIGLQWHPERMWEKDRKMLEIFKGLVDAAKGLRAF